LKMSSLAGIVKEHCSCFPAFYASHDLKLFAKEFNHGNKVKKAKQIFDWMTENVKYDQEQKYYKSATEVYWSRTGVCFDMSLLYIVLSRLCGLKTKMAIVKKDYLNERVHHACVSLEFMFDKILVDPAYYTFNIRHRKYKLVNDDYVRSMYNAFNYKAMHSIT